MGVPRHRRWGVRWRRRPHPRRGQTRRRVHRRRECGRHPRRARGRDRGRRAGRGAPSAVCRMAVRGRVARVKAVMLVSANAGDALRSAVRAGDRPRPEFLALEAEYGVRLLDWSQLGLDGGRSARMSIQHAAAGMRAAGGADVVFSDGEHLGIPLGIALQTLGPARPHVMLGHHLTTRSKPQMLRWLRHMGITRVLVHSRTQLKIAIEQLGFGADGAAFVPYFADASFWRPQPVDARSIIVSAGREHRDYATLAAAVDGLADQVVIAAGSLYSPDAECRPPKVMPANIP